MTLILRTCLLAMLLTIPALTFAQTGKKTAKDTTSTAASKKQNTSEQNTAAKDSVKTPVKKVVPKKINRDSLNEAKENEAEEKAALAEARRDSARSKFAMRAARVRDSVEKARTRNAFVRDSTLKAKKNTKPAPKVAKDKPLEQRDSITGEIKPAMTMKRPDANASATPVITGTFDDNVTPIMTKSASYNYFVIPAGDKGVLIFNENVEKANSKGRFWTITRYDKDFKEVYSKDITISYATELEKYVVSPDGLMHVLFTQHSIAAYNSYVTKGYYEILNIDIEKGISTKTDGMLDFNLAIESFGVVGSAAFIGGKTVPPLSEERSLKALGYVGLGVPFLFNITFIPGEPVLVYANLETGAAKFVDVKYDGSAEISNIEADEAKGYINVTLSEYTEAGESKLYILSYDQQGNEKGAQVIKAKPEYLLATGSLRNTSDGKLILGTFAFDPEKELNSKKANSKDNEADGFYICKIGEVKPSFVQYYPFSRIKNFDKSTAQAEDHNYSLLFHDPIVTNDQYVITAELYTPYYDMEGRFVTEEKGGLKKQVVPVFEYYTFTHVITFGLDRTTGKMLWNKLTEIDRIVTLNLSEKSGFATKGETNMLTFESKNNLRSKVVSANENGEGKVAAKMTNKYAGESGDVKYRYDAQPWHDNVWISYSHPFKKTDPLSKNPKDLKPQKAVIGFSKFTVK